MVVLAQAGLACRPMAAVIPNTPAPAMNRRRDNLEMDNRRFLESQSCLSVIVFAPLAFCFSEDLNQLDLLRSSKRHSILIGRAPSIRKGSLLEGKMPIPI